MKTCRDAFRAAALLLALLGTLGACRRPPPAVAPYLPPTPAPSTASPSPIPAATPGLPDFAVDAVATREGMAVWYDVPDQSLAERRAWPGEMTAASDSLALNTYVRVRRADGEHPGRSVVVRITDRGLHRRGTLIDLDRQAAETLGMVRDGAVRVRVETLALKNADTAKSTEKKDVPPPVSQLTSTPAATKEQEQATAAKNRAAPSP